MRRNCSVITEPGEDGDCVVHLPALPGCITQGRTEDDARANAKEAIEASLESLRKHNRPIPAPGSVRITGGAVEV